MTSWEEVWARRQVDERSGSSLLRQLLDADGMDGPTGWVTQDAWRAFVLSVADELGLRPGMEVLEVGCGAGAFLLPLAETGIRVCGIDRSASLVEVARRAIPEGSFVVAEAARMPPDLTADVVLSMGVFLYFPSSAYAEATLDAMVGAARHAVALLDLPDSATAAQALAERERLAGGPEAYAARYAGLEHRYYDRGSTVDALRARGLTGIAVEGQRLAGYANGPYRFNAWGRLEP